MVVNPELLESDADVEARVTVEIRLRAVTKVIDGTPVGEVAERYGVTRQTVTAWRKRYEAGSLEALSYQSRRPHSSPGRTPMLKRWSARCTASIDAGELDVSRTN